MTTHVALIRGINVGGHKQVAMADLRRLCERLGLDNVQSLLNSGNLIFRSEGRPGSSLERLLETETQKRIGIETDFFVRSAREWLGIIAGNPFRTEAKRDPSHLAVMFLKDEVDSKDVKALQGAITGPEVVRGKGRQVYIIYPAGFGTSRLTTTVIERTFGTRVTGRNWNTVVKLGTLTTS